MKQIGEKLRYARIEKKLTLDDISQETKIKVKYLKNIEEGEFNKIPGGEAYVKGFIKNYANSVDMNSEEILLEYKKLKKEEFDELKDEQLSNQVPKKAYSKNIFLYIGTAIIIVITIISIFFVFKKGDLPTTQKSLKTQQKADNDSTSSNSEINKSNILKKPEESNKPAQNKQNKIIKIKEDKNNVYYLIDSNKINVKFKTTDNCWISVKVDGISFFEGTVKKTDNVKEWVGQEKIIIRIGNPLVAKVYINDLELSDLGKTSRNFIFEKSR